MSANLQACAFLLGRLQREVVRLRAVAFPGHDTGPRKWLNLTVGLLDTASSYLASAQVAGLSADEISKLIKEAERLGGKAYELLTFVAGADSSQIPHQVVAPFQRWVAGLGITQTLFFRAEHLPNYELQAIDHRNDSLLIDASQSLIDAISDISWPALRVSVPGQAMGLLPHFAVVAHELGHAIQGRISPDFTPFEPAANDAVDRAKARLQKDGITFTTEDELTAQQIVNSWVNEFKADAVGHYLVGPAFFFAFSGFLELAGQGYGIGRTHPPSELRRALLFQKLNEGNSSFCSVLQQKTGLVLTEDFTSPHIARCPDADTLYAMLRPRIGDAKAALCVELAPFFATLAPAIFEAARIHLEAHSSPLIYTPDQLALDLDRHLEFLCNLVPPIEFREGDVTKPCSLSTILNVGWAALLTKVERFPPARGLSPSDSVAARMECLHELLLKAAELAEARQLWEEQA